MKKVAVKIDQNSGSFTFTNFTTNRDTKKAELESTIISKGGEFKFSYENGDEKTFVIKFNDNEWVYTVRFKGLKIVLFTIEYLDFARDLTVMLKKKIVELLKQKRSCHSCQKRF